MKSQNIILYGAGQFGQCVYEFFKYMNLSNDILGFCDKDSKRLRKVKDKKVYAFGELKEKNAQFIITVYNQDDQAEIRELLERSQVCYYQNINDWAAANGFDLTEWNREFCKFYHIKEMDQYFENAESKEELSRFCGKETSFYRLFQKLDLENVIELACGRGRHLQNYIERAQTVTLVDILDKNIEFCKNRFSDKTNIEYYCNDGYSLKALESNAYTSLFTYDSMVHFELFDIAAYLEETYRVLKPGSYALIHHSNNAQDYTASFSESHHGRNFMSKQLFAYLAHHAGFDITEQEVLDWGLDKDLDCLSLIQKPIV